jgi:hypothetical protein
MNSGVRDVKLSITKNSIRKGKNEIIVKSAASLEKAPKLSSDMLLTK